ncbi:hypothetical protein [Campylobacter sp. IFREMER_LSEM_CL1085]|uniref:hypothetical protein n=1 Tax=Campylobacter sp. IFREMER_LSEM_CL1085 TaxID=2911612 RepID=UPI0021E63C2E|nr:hypothetical protein [Campylobacter sp. IFREMER_LSEM_CL1085]MCV3424537.1 hypothetical protein [Campylobacter sp. IFREMER_LSEM_CL1085]
MKNILSELVEKWDFDILEKQLKKESCNNASYYVSFLYNIGKLKKAYKELYQLNTFGMDIKIENGLSFLDFKECININSSSQKVDFDLLCTIMHSFDKLKKNKTLSAEWICNSFNEYIAYGDRILKAYYISSTLNYLFANKDILNDFIYIKIEKKIKFLDELYRYNSTGSKKYIKLFINECGNIRNFGDSYIRKPKIAVGFIGMLRGDWENNLANLIKDISIQYNADYFVASWNCISRFPGMNTGVADWTRRLLSLEFNKQFPAPKEVADKVLFYKYFPKVYKELSYAYEELGVNKQKLCKKMLNISNKIKNISLESQAYLSLHLVAGEYSYYLSNKVFRLIENYETMTKTNYDYIFLIRIDSQINDLGLKKIHLSNLDNNTLIELHGIGGSMVVAKRDIVKVYTTILENYNLLSKYCTIENPHQTIPYYLSINGIKRIEEPCIRISNTYALNGIVFPDVTRSLEQDLHVLGDTFTKEQKNNVREFFSNIYSYYSSDCSMLKKKYIVPYIGSAEDNKRKNRRQNFALEYIKTELPFRIGSVMVGIYKSNKYKLLFTPYIIQKIIYEYEIDLKDYNLQSDYCNDLKLLPIEYCDDYLESQKLKENYIYKIGEMVLKAQRSRFKLGYLILLLKLLRKQY